ncbi:MAG: hypothetical protein HYR56_20515 [Acidobacteria bacterium]|nr:hypothetical protein [Acidobacteriota bacterium]MBI3428414.1 hypothetical protein [Acidobacteriota bacterium]
MFRKSLIASALLMIAFGLLALTDSSGARARPPVSAELTAQQQQEVNCADRSAIYVAIYKILRTDANLNNRKQLEHINVSFSVIKDARGNITFSKDEVTLRGWALAAEADADKMSAINQVEALIRKATKCVAKVNKENLANYKQISCPDGFRDCGELCIPINEDCNIPPPPG